MSDQCNGHCDDCPFTWCNPAPVARQSKAERRKGWRQDAQSELDDLGDLYDIDLTKVRL